MPYLKLMFSIFWEHLLMALPCTPVKGEDPGPVSDCAALRRRCTCGASPGRSAHIVVALCIVGDFASTEVRGRGGHSASTRQLQKLPGVSKVQADRERLPQEQEA